MPKKMPDDLAQEITEEIIALFAKRRDPEFFGKIFKEVAGKHEICYSEEKKGQYNNFYRTCQGRFFSRLGTDPDGWRTYPEKARRYLGIPETPSQPKPPIMPRAQDTLPF